MSLQRMNERRRLLVLVLIMGCVALTTMGLSIWVLYQAAFDEERVRLTELVQSQARLIEAVARFDAIYSQPDHPGGASAATLSQVVEANKKYQGFGESGEFALARREEDSIVFLLEHREQLDDHAERHRPPAVPFDSDIAEPMRRALSGQSGTIIGRDYRGVMVLAAYEPVAVLNLGIVAKIDLAEVRAPFIRAGIVSSFGALFFFLLGVPFFRLVFNPVVGRLEKTVTELAKAQRIAHLGNWEWNVVTNEVRWSDEIYRIIGLEPQEFEATFEAFLATVHPDDRPTVEAAVYKALNEKKPYAIDHRIVLRSGEVRFVHEQAEVTFDAGKAIRMSGTVQDITERKRAEAQLQQAQKMEVIGNLTGGIAHDFNNLLTVILGNLQLLDRSVEGDERLLKRVQAATNATLRGADLTKRLLAFSRRQVLEPKLVKLNDLVMGVHELLGRTLGEAIEIKTIVAKDLWPTHVDPGQLENVLLNLAINARDAMPEGGKLTIETANAPLDEAYAAHRSYVVPGDYVMLAVTDTGTGMSPEVLDSAFEPFFTTKEAGQGSGLGLSMVYGFVKQSAGYVNIYSEMGHGTTVKVYLPKAKPSDAAAAEEVESYEEVPSGKETILVVEDDAAVRETAVALLEELGYRVLEAEDGPSALAIVDQGEDFDLLLTDVVMPGGMSGAVVARRVREHHPRVKVLYSSGYTQNAIAHGGMLDEGVELIAKPYLREALGRKVRRVLDS